MQPVGRLTTAADQRRYTLPLDFKDFVGDTIQYDGEDYAYGAINILPAVRLMQLRNDYENTGVPTAAAKEPLAHDGATEQQWQLVLHPTPDGSYDLIYQYQIGARMLTAANPYPPGGPSYGQLFLAACLAAAEAKFDDDAQGEKYKAFMTRLTTDIAKDLGGVPRNLGYMGGRRGRARSRSELRRVLDLQSGYTTYDGSTDL
jgi:hypothetical protein